MAVECEFGTHDISELATMLVRFEAAMTWADTGEELPMADPLRLEILSAIAAGGRELGYEVVFS